MKDSLPVQNILSNVKLSFVDACPDVDESVLRHEERAGIKYPLPAQNMPSSINRVSFVDTCLVVDRLLLKHEEGAGKKYPLPAWNMPSYIKMPYHVNLKMHRGMCLNLGVRCIFHKM